MECWNERNEKSLESMKGNTPNHEISRKNIVQEKSDGLAEEERKREREKLTLQLKWKVKIRDGTTLDSTWPHRGIHCSSVTIVMKSTYGTLKTSANRPKV